MSNCLDTSGKTLSWYGDNCILPHNTTANCVQKSFSNSRCTPESFQNTSKFYRFHDSITCDYQNKKIEVFKPFVFGWVQNTSAECNAKNIRLFTVANFYDFNGKNRPPCDDVRNTMANPSNELRQICLPSHTWDSTILLVYDSGSESQVGGTTEPTPNAKGSGSGGEKGIKLGVTSLFIATTILIGIVLY